VFEKGTAVWIEGGILYTWLFSVPCDEVVAASCGQQQISMFVKKEAVILQLRYGQRKSFPTGSLSEPRDIIISRLNAALRLGPLAK
jgi:hypothetical protein